MLNQDIAYIYDPSQTIIKKKIKFENDSLKLFLSFEDPYDHLSSQEFINRYSFYYKIKQDYISTEAIYTDSIKLNEDDIITVKNVHYLSYSFKNQYPSYSLFILERFDKKRRIVDLIDIPLTKDSSSIKNSSILYKYNSRVPVLDNFILKGDSFTIKVANCNKELLKIYNYNNPIPPGIRPYDESIARSINQLKFDFNREIQTDTIVVFNSTGLNYLSPSDNIKGFSLIVVDKKFPYITTAEEMIDPLYYITSEKEYNFLKSSIHPKQTLDSFWLSIGGSPEYSRKLIKSFYQKVEYANRSFTTYKEGWKTDRGMIFIVFGKPDEVYRHNDLEEWTYENISNNTLTFNFIKRNNSLSNDDYELIRKKSFEYYWKETIEKWRKGNIIK